MANNSSGDLDPRFDFVGLIRRHGRLSLIVTATVTALVALGGTAYLNWGQPVRRASVLELRPTFDGASRGEYPNGLPFSPTDIAAVSVLDLVYDSNGIGEYCPRELFRSGFYVEQRSDQSSFLDAEYQSRLSDSRITGVERQRLQAEYEAKRAALPAHYRLVFVKPRPCVNVPQVVVTKVMSDVLSTWANESETKRGVLRHQVEILTPAMLDVGLGPEGSRLLRADLLRTALWRIIENIGDVDRIPGALMIRHGPNRVTFLEIKNKLTDVVRSRLEPLVVGAGQSMVRESSAWVAETVAAAERERDAAARRAAAYRAALQQYSGGGIVAPETSRTAAGPAGDVQTLSPQIDRTFIDRIVEMSESNTAFRQELTASMVRASVEEVVANERASYYQRLAQSLRQGGGAEMPAAEIDSRLDDIVAQGKALTAQFNEIYEEFSRVALRPAGAMYQTDKPVTTEVSRSFSLRSLLMLVITTAMVSLVASFAILFGRDRLRGVVGG